jgi:hypothetical protein
MNFTSLIKVACVGTVLAVSSGAVYAGGTAQNHHCKLQDGSMDMKKTKKECKAAKGTWAKDAAAPAAPAAPAAAPAPKN